MALFLLAPGCSEPPQRHDDTDTDSDEGDTGDSAGSTGLDPDTSESTTGAGESTTGESTGEPIDPSTTATAETTDASTDASSDGSTGVGVVCGDGVVDGDEVCDDGINDDSYGGCASDCSALGPHCGDGDVNGEEMCDDGVANENGHGCNVDCVVSGTLLATYEVSLGNDCGGWAIEPAVRGDGNVLIAYRDCDQVWVLRELSPDLVEVASTTATFSTDPTQSIERGTDWILGGWECDTVVADDGSVTEVCASGRVSGYDALEAVDDESYLTLLDVVVAQWGVDSPAEGDAPEWTATVPPAGEDESYGFQTVTPGSAGSVVAAGGYSAGYGSYAAGYVRVFDSAGNPIASRTYDELFGIEAIASSPSGALVASGWQSITGANLMRLDENLDPSWAITTCAFGPHHFAVDSAEQIAIDCGSGSQLRKLDDEGEELWSTDLLGLESPDTPTRGGLVIDATDHIVRSTALHDPLVPEWRLRIERYAP